MSFGIRRPAIKTLRARLTLWYLAILALSVVLFAAFLYLSLNRDLYRLHDGELREEAARLVHALTGVALTDASIRPSVHDSLRSVQFLVIQNVHGEVLFRVPQPQMGESDIVNRIPLVRGSAGGHTGPQFSTVELERFGTVRLVRVPLGVPARAYLHVGNPVGDVPAILHSVAVLSALLVPAVLLLTSFGGWFIAKRALAPIAAIDSTLETIQATDLSRRIEVGRTDEEISRLVEAVNHLLDRLEQGFRTSREFSADVSHQLQTPLTVMKGTLEVALSSARDTEEYRHVLADLVEEVNDLVAIVEGLHALSVADARLPDADTGSIDLAESCHEAADIITALGESQGIRVDTEIQAGVQVRGDVVRLKQILLNLGDNAVKYSAEGGCVRIGLTVDAGQAVLSVSDQGRGIPDEQRGRIFDRFYRLDESRAGVAGTGLGLAIVKRIAEAHGGSAWAENVDGGAIVGFEIDRKA